MKKYILIQTINRETIKLGEYDCFDEAHIEMKNKLLKELRDKEILDKNGNTIEEIYIGDSLCEIDEQFGFEQYFCWLNYKDDDYDWNILEVEF
jgi:hypothetical protein